MEILRWVTIPLAQGKLARSNNTRRKLLTTRTRKEGNEMDGVRKPMNMGQSREEDDDDKGGEIGLVVDVVRNYRKTLTQFSGTRAGAGCAFLLSLTHFQTW
jgi:hypothetical protein